MIMAIVKDFIKRSEGLGRSVKTLLGSEVELTADPVCLREKNFNTLSNFELEKFFLSVFIKSGFQYCQGLVHMV